MSLSSMNSIGQTVFELESGNEKCGQTDGRWTHQSNRRVGYILLFLKVQVGSECSFLNPVFCMVLKLNQ